jgi:hypothetical protein
MSRQLHIGSAHSRRAEIDSGRGDLLVRRRTRASGAVGALALGAFALGAFAIGALAINRMAIRQARIGRLSVGRLEVDELILRDRAQRSGM